MSTSPGEGILFPKDRNWLFCDSTFLSLEENTAPALDKNGNQIRDTKGNSMKVQDIPKYVKEFKKNPTFKAWWSGGYTDIKGYFFDADGANFCSLPNNRGVTAAVRPLSATGKVMIKAEIAGIIICPSSFDGNVEPNSYRDANNKLAPGASFATAIPKSTTLLHEAFHAIFAQDVLAGDEENCV